MTAVDVRIYEVGPRDGLQAEPTIVATEDKLRFIEMLADAGLREIETTSLVSPKAVPQLADAERLWPRSSAARGPLPGAGAEPAGPGAAVEAGVDAICLITAATDSYVRHNIGMSQEESLAAFEPIAAEARQRGWWIRGYVSTAFGCPYEGEVEASAVVASPSGCAPWGSTSWRSATRSAWRPRPRRRVLGALTSAGIGPDMIGLHFHDTRGTALANVIAALEVGVRTLRRLDRRDGWLALRARRGRQPGDRGPGLPARPPGPAPRRGPGWRAGRRSLHRVALGRTSRSASWGVPAAGPIAR